MRRKLFGDYGMVLVLIVLCLFFSVLTFKEQMPEGSDAITEIFDQINRRYDKSDIILVAGAATFQAAQGRSRAFRLAATLKRSPA